MEARTEKHLGHAGRFLRDYENERFLGGEPRESVQRIIVPSNARNFADVSFYQGEMNWDVYKDKSEAAIIRIGQGIWIDSQFERNYSETKRIGILLGGYWFFDDRYSPQKQFDTIMSAVSGKTFEMEIFVDWEVNYGGQHFGLQHVIALIELLVAAGIKCKAFGIYTGYYFMTENSSPVSNASQYNYIVSRGIVLWLAWYALAFVVKVPQPWTEWKHWQKGTPSVGKEWGAQSVEIDMNTHNGDFSEYEGGSTPPSGGDMIYQGTVIATAGLNVRSSPNGTKLFAMPYLTKIEADKVENKWWHLTRINGASISGENWSFEGETQGYIRTDAVIEPEPPSELPAYFIGYDLHGNPLGRYNKEEE